MPVHTDGIFFDELSADPSSPVEGQTWFNTTEKRYKCFANGSVDVFGTLATRTVQFSLDIANVGAPNYTLGASFIFEGSDTVGTPSVFKAIARQNSTSADLRVYDATNSLEICTVNYTNTVDAIVTFGAISNIPTGEAMFELQYKETGSGKLWVASLSMVF